MEALLEGIIAGVNSILRDKILIVVLPLVGLFFTLYLGFPQIRRFPAAIKNTFGPLFDKEENKRKKAAGEISSFQALAVAVAAQVGTGNVAGVATAILMGGPGAVFWMWIAAILGMGTIFAEAVLAQKYRTKDKEGNLVGGPAYYISQGFKKRGMEGFGKFLSAFFAISIVIALGFIGNLVQSNSISAAVNEAFNINKVVIGVAIAILAALIFIGGIKRIASFAEMIVPVMAVVYIALAILAMIKFHDQIIPSLKTIFASAFGMRAIAGGTVGAAIKKAVNYGVARGLFSNEAGMGSTPHAHATAHVKHPAEQGLTAIVGVFIDTILVCTATAIVIMLTGAFESGKEGALMSQEAFSIAFPGWGKEVLAICLTCFAFTTIVGWYYFGETNIKYLFGDKGLLPYRILVILFIILGSFQKVGFVWEMADMFNIIMVLPNLLALVILHGEVKEIERDYDKCKKIGKIEYTYEYE